MNSPFNGDFYVSQTQHSAHDGFDLVPKGTDKNVYSTVSGKVIFAGWENPNDVKQGFGQFVCIQTDATHFYYFGHLSEISVKYGDTVKCTDKIGVVGHTGHCIPDNEYGTHLHYCCRKQFGYGNVHNISELSGIPNAVDTYNDGYVPSKVTEAKPTEKGIKIYVEIDGVKYSGELLKVST